MNIDYRFRAEIPIFFHNLKGYDAHLILQKIANHTKEFSCIPLSYEKYVSFTMDRGLIFKDSMQFMPSSLETLVQNMKKGAINHEKLKKEHPNLSDKDKNNMRLLSKLGAFDLNKVKAIFPNMSRSFCDKDLDLMTNKGVYPYDYMDSIEKFNDEKLPTKDEFFNKLNDSHLP